MMTNASGRAATIVARGFADAPQQQRQPSQHRRKTHDVDVGHVKEADQALGRHRRTADADEADLPPRDTAESRHQFAAERVARGLSGDDRKPQRRRAHGTPARKSPAASAAAIACGREAISTCPLASANPLREARLAAAIVAGPMLGRSTRKSWPCFRRLHEHAGAALARKPTLGFERGDAGQHRVRAFRALNGHDTAFEHDAALAKIEGRGGGEQRKAMARGLKVGACGRDAPERARFGREAGRDVKRSDHFDAFALDHGDDALQQRIVASGE